MPASDPAEGEEARSHWGFCVLEWEPELATEQNAHECDSCFSALVNNLTIVLNRNQSLQ